MKKGKMRFSRCAALLLGLLILSCACAGAEEAGDEYVENEWNFVDGSMDVSQGIPSNAEGALYAIREAGRLRVATEPYFPPQEFIDPSLSGQAQYVGADMELARLIAEKMGVELEIVPLDFTDVLPAVADGRCDLAISALAFTPARAAQAELSKGYFFTDDNTASGIVIRIADAEKITSIQDLADKNLVAQSGSLQETLTAENVTLYREFRRLASIQDVYDAVKSGRADAGTVNLEAARAYIQNNPDCGLTVAPNIQFLLEPQFQGDRIAGKKGELSLLYFVNGVIDELLAKDQYQQWFQAYEQYAGRLGL